MVRLVRPQGVSTMMASGCRPSDVLRVPRECRSWWTCGSGNFWRLPSWTTEQGDAARKTWIYPARRNPDLQSVFHWVCKRLQNPAPQSLRQSVETMPCIMGETRSQASLDDEVPLRTRRPHVWQRVTCCPRGECHTPTAEHCSRLESPILLQCANHGRRRVGWSSPKCCASVSAWTCCYAFARYRLVGRMQRMDVGHCWLHYELTHSRSDVSTVVRIRATPTPHTVLTNGLCGPPFWSLANCKCSAQKNGFLLCSECHCLTGRRSEPKETRAPSLAEEPGADSSGDDCNHVGKDCCTLEESKPLRWRPCQVARWLREGCTFSVFCFWTRTTLSKRYVKSLMCFKTWDMKAKFTLDPLLWCFQRKSFSSRGIMLQLQHSTWRGLFIHLHEMVPSQSINFTWEDCVITCNG